MTDSLVVFNNERLSAWGTLAPSPLTFECLDAASVVEHGNGVTGYATDLAFFAHAVGETTRNLMALIGVATAFGGPGILMVQVMTLMTIGLYNEPAGAYRRSVLYCFSCSTVRGREEADVGRRCPTHAVRRSRAFYVTGMEDSAPSATGVRRLMLCERYRPGRYCFRRKFPVCWYEPCSAHDPRSWVKRC